MVSFLPFVLQFGSHFVSLFGEVVTGRGSGWLGRIGNIQLGNDSSIMVGGRI